MENAPVQKTNESAGLSAFYRVDNPRELRLPALLLKRRQFIDRDGQKVRAGFYSLTPTDRQRAISALRIGGA